MKLRNKKTGEIGELHYYPDKAYHFAVSAKDPLTRIKADRVTENGTVLSVEIDYDPTYLKVLYLNMGVTTKGICFCKPPILQKHYLANPPFYKTNPPFYKNGNR